MLGAAMKFRFNSEEWERLSVEERIHRCALIAAEARKLAETAPPALRETYLSLAADWEKLAVEMGRRTGAPEP